MTSSWFFLSTLNYDARSTTHQICNKTHCESSLLTFLQPQKTESHQFRQEAEFRIAPLHSKTLPNAVTDYVVFLPRIWEIPRWNPEPGISWLRIPAVLRTTFMEILGLYCIKLLKRALHSAPFHFVAITFDTIQSELLTVNLLAPEFFF